MHKLLIWGLLAALILETPVTGQITVAAAADLNAALNQIASTYQKRTGKEVRLVFGASGNLFSQIQNGAPFDLFLSADLDYPKKLVDAGLADGSSLYTYGIGRLILWVPASSPLDVQHRGVQVLLDPRVKKIAIANPQHAPYGRAAVAALRNLGIYDKISDRLVLGENVSQATQFVESGNAQAGLVAYSHAVAPVMKNKGKYWEFPADSHPRLEQAAVLLSHSQHKKEAAEFLDYLKTPEAISVLRQFGFSMPQEKP